MQFFVIFNYLSPKSTLFVSLSSQTLTKKPNKNGEIKSK